MITRKFLIAILRRGFLFLLLPATLSWAADEEDAWTGVDRVVAIGDVHGDCEQFVAVLRSAGLIDAREDWSGGKTHLVQTGDLLDRGPDSRKAMDLLIKLEEQARRSGGFVHALIGNHEAMNLYGDLRYVAPGEIDAFRDAGSEKAREALYLEHQKQLRDSLPAAQVPAFDDAHRKKWESETPLGYAEHRRAFSPAGTYGKWIRRHNAVIRIDETLFLHGGISPKYARLGIREINDRIRAELADFKKLEGGIAQDEKGPLWYRGLALGDERALEPELQAVLKNFGVDRIVIGHTYTDGTVTPRFATRVLQIDVGLARLYDPSLRMACLLIEKGKPLVLHRGKRLELPLDSGPDLLRYFKQAAALDPDPSSLAPRIAGLEARRAEPAKK
jgi:hypothetical protein